MIIYLRNLNYSNLISLTYDQIIEDNLITFNLKKSLNKKFLIKYLKDYLQINEIFVNASKF